MQNTRNLNSNNKLTVQEDDEGMRLDNYLIKILKGIPKSRIYRMIRKGEVRVVVCGKIGRASCRERV